MTTVKKIGLVLLIAVLIAVIPQYLGDFIYGVVTGKVVGDQLVWVYVLAHIAAIAFLIGGIIYVAVDAAIRHNRQDTTPPR